jgi:hypothetical protein
MESLPANPYSDLQFLALVRSAFELLRVQLVRHDRSVLFERVWSWMSHLSGSPRPEDYYLKPRSAPLLLLPWWLELSLTASPDHDFQTDLIYATINKYYFVRLVDDVMDGHDADPVLLPMLSIWDAQFQAAYGRHFEAHHPFWEYFHQTLRRTALVTAQERTLRNIDRSAFLDCSASKSCGATIALLAVCYHCDRLDVFPAWLRFWEAFARWNQMRDDLFDWYRDLKDGNPSYLLSEGQRRKRQEESLECWFVREGFAWATELLGEWTRDMKEQASHLGSPALEQYVEFRAMDLGRQIAEVAMELESLAALSRLEL